MSRNSEPETKRSGILEGENDITASDLGQE